MVFTSSSSSKPNGEGYFLSKGETPLSPRVLPAGANLEAKVTLEEHGDTRPPRVREAATGQYIFLVNVGVKNTLVSVFCWPLPLAHRRDLTRLFS